MEIGANTGKMLQCANEEDGIAKNLNQISASLQNGRKSLQKCLSTSAAGKIDSALANAYQRLNRSRSDTQQLAGALRNVAGIYEATERDISGSKPTGSQISVAKNVSGKTSAGKQSMGSAVAKSAAGLNLFAQTADAYKTATKVQKKINQAEKALPEAVKVAIKKIYNDAVGNENSALKALKGVDDAYKIWSKIADGDYEKALGSFIKKCGGGIIVQGEGINWTGAKIMALADSLQLALDQDSYANKNYDKYLNNMATNYFLDGDIAGGLSSLIGGILQVPGKGAVDVACQLTSSLADGLVSQATGGTFTLSSINQMMYEACGTSPGHMFNEAAKAISDGVDVIIDDGLIKGSSALGNIVGDIAKGAISKVASIF